MNVTRHNGTFFNVVKLIVINLVIILIYAGHFPTQARKLVPFLIDDDQHSRLNRPGELNKYKKITHIQSFILLETQFRQNERNSEIVSNFKQLFGR